MAEVDNTDAPVETKVPGNIVSAGKPQPANFNIDAFNFPENTDTTPAEQVIDKQEVVDTTTPPAEVKAPELTDDQLKEILKGKGISFDDFDSLKKKLETPAPVSTITEEEQRKIDFDNEKKLFDIHTKRGGTVEQFAALKGLLSAEAKDLGVQKIITDLQKEGFSAEQAANIAKKMHLQITDEELEQIDDEDEKALLKKERDFGSKKQENRGLYTKNTAKSYFDSLKAELQDMQTEKEKMEQHTAKAVDAIKNFQRNQTLELGEYEGVQLGQVDFNVSDDVLNEVLDIVKDPEKLEQHLYTKEGDLNLDFLIPHLVNSIAREKNAKHSFLSGQTKAIDHMKSTFGSTTPSLGSNAKPEGQKGKIVGAGKPQPFRPTTLKNN